MMATASDVSPRSIAKRLFDGTDAEMELEELLTNVPHERFSWDYYDCSLELHVVPAEYRLPETIQSVLYEAGFRKVYMNHVDHWETHYSFPSESFQPRDGWRVCYQQKHGLGESVLVEKTVDTWPEEWFKTGYAKVVRDAVHS